MFEFKTDDYKELEEILAKHKFVIIDFTASWCGPCQKMAPFVEKKYEEYKEIVYFIKMDVDQNADICQKLHIKSMPTFKFYKNEKALYEFSSADGNKFITVLNLLLSE